MGLSVNGPFYMSDRPAHLLHVFEVHVQRHDTTDLL